MLLMQEVSGRSDWQSWQWGHSLNRINIEVYKTYSIVSFPWGGWKYWIGQTERINCRDVQLCGRNRLLRRIQNLIGNLKEMQKKYKAKDFPAVSSVGWYSVFSRTNKVTIQVLKWLHMCKASPWALYPCNLRIPILKEHLGLIIWVPRVN